MATFVGGRAYDITSVEFGIEQALSLFGTDQPLTVNLYINHGSPFPDGDWQSNLLVSSGKIRIPNQENTLFNVPLTATVPAGTLELVMEVLSPDQTVEHNFFIIGSNPDPETGPSYLSAPDCGNPDPVATRCIGFPDMHYVFNVNGSCAGGGATPTPTPTPSCTPMAITGSIDNNDSTQNDRLNRGVISGCCGTTYPCQIFGDGQPHHYDAYTFTNTTGSTQCVTVGIDTDCQGSNFIFTAAYLGTFDPNNICSNWIADEGQSPVSGNTTPFSFNIEDGQTVRARSERSHRQYRLPVLYNDRVGFVRRRHANANSHPAHHQLRHPLPQQDLFLRLGRTQLLHLVQPPKRRPVIRRSVPVRTASLLCQVMPCLIRTRNAFENLKI
jgi:hypothetical protein